MILTDYFRSEKDVTWDFAKQCGVNHGVIRLPEDAGFDITDKSHWKTVYNRFIGNGIKPIVIEPMPDSVHSHIKTGDCFRDESIEKVIKMFPIMRELGINLICFNWMAYVGWTRTSTNLPERGGATVTGFDINDYPNAYDMYSNEVTLPLHTKLSDEQIDYIIENFNEVLRG